MPRDLCCENCCYWSRYTPAPQQSYGQRFAPVEEPPAFKPNGQCRRFPPFMGMTQKGLRAQWPITIAEHWCGEHGVIEASRRAPGDE